MKTVELSFGRMHVHEKDLGELIINDGVEVSTAMTTELTNTLHRHLEQPFRLLVDKRHNYSFTFSAQLALKHIYQQCAVAVLVYSRASGLAVRTAANVADVDTGDYSIFTCRETALNWLNINREVQLGSSTLETC